MAVVAQLIDTFAGSFGTTLNGRAPDTATPSGIVWDAEIEAEEGWWGAELDGTGSVYGHQLPESDGGYPSFWVTYPTPITSAVSVVTKVVVRGMTVPPGNAAIDLATTSSQSVSVTVGVPGVGSYEIRMRPTAVEFLQGTGDLTSIGTVGAAGAPVTFEVQSTLGGVINVYVNDALIVSGTVDAGTIPSELNTSVAFARNNRIDSAEITIDAGDPEPPERRNVLIKNLVRDAVEERHDVPGTPYIPAQPGRYVYESRTVCGWVHQGPGHYENWRDPFTGQVSTVWIPTGPGGDTAIWTCTTQKVPVYYPPTPAVPATPGSSYSTTRYETGFNLGWNSGARSIDVFSGDAYVQFQVAASVVGVIVGMNIDDGTPVSYNGNTINYGIYAARGVARLMQNGVMGATLGVYTNETVFKIERTDDEILYYMDGDEVANVASGAPTGAGWMEAAMYSGNDIVFNPSMASIAGPDLTEQNGDVAGSFPAMEGMILCGSLCLIDGDMAPMTALITSGELVPSYAVINGEISIFGSDIRMLVGELCSVAGSFQPMDALIADHAYAEILGAEMHPMDGYIVATEGNNSASFVGSGAALGEVSAKSFLVATFTSTGQLLGAFAAVIGNAAELRSSATWAGALTFTSIQQAILWGTAATSAATSVPEGEIETWVINLEGGAFGSTEYENYDFNSYAVIAGKHYGAGPDGLVLLEGQTDALGEKIAAVMGFGQRDFGTNAQKIISECYLGMSAQGNLFVKVIAEGCEYIYQTEDFSAQMQQQRVKFGKGLKANYLTVELYNEDGSDFELDSVQFMVADLSRKIY